MSRTPYRAAALARFRELSARATLNVFESAELEALETQFGQTQLNLMSKPVSKPAKQPKSPSLPVPKSPPLAAQPRAGETVQLLRADTLLRSPWNRKIFSEPGLAEMEASIREHGIIEPLIARPLPADRFHVEAGKISGKPCFFLIDRTRVKGAGDYDGVAPHFPTEDEAKAALPAHELVAGERRWRGAQRIDPHYRVPVIVRILTDREALEAQKIENLQREDLDPIEEGQGLKQMIEEFGYTLDDLKTRLGKEKSAIYARIKLANLCPEGVKHFRAGCFAESVAVRIARIPLHALQVKFLDEQNLDPDEPLTDRDAAFELDRGFMKQLKGAPFKTSDATLLPVEFGPSGDPAVDPAPVRLRGGACDDCPMRAGNLPDFDPKQGRADMCLNPSCYRLKVDAAFRVQGAAVVAKGGTVADPSKAFDRYGCLDYKSPLKQITDRCWEVAALPKRKDSPTLGELAAHLKLPVVLTQNPKTGEILTLIDKPAALAAAKQAGLKVDARDSGSGQSDWRAAEKARQAKEKKARTLRACQLDSLCCAAADTSDAPLAFIQQVTRCLTRDASDETCRLIAARRKLDTAKFKQSHGAGHRPAVAALGKNAAGWAQCKSIIIEVLATAAPYSGQNDPLKAFAEIFKVNLAKVPGAPGSTKPQPAPKPKPKGKLTPVQRLRALARVKAAQKGAGKS